MKTRGFTLIELIMILILTGVLAVAVMPRFFDRNTFDARGFQDEVLAALRFAQKSAIAQRRDVCVTFASNNVTLTIAISASPSTCVTGTKDANTTDLASPSGTTPYQVTGRTSSVVFQSTPTNFKFNALGQPQPNSRQTIQVVGAANTITIEQETGYVHQ